MVKSTKPTLITRQDIINAMIKRSKRVEKSLGGPGKGITQAEASYFLDMFEGEFKK